MRTFGFEWARSAKACRGVALADNMSDGPGEWRLWVVEEFNPAANGHQSYRLKRLAIRLAHECRHTRQRFFNAIGQDR